MKRHETNTKRPEFFTVDVDAIQCSTPASDYPPAAIAQGAELIARAGGLARPLLLSRGDYDPALGDYRYHLITGALAYHAAAAYRDAHPRAGESVNALVILGDTSAAEMQALLFE